jgi:hypothetical protein
MTVRMARIFTNTFGWILPRWVTLYSPFTAASFLLSTSVLITSLYINNVYPVTYKGSLHLCLWLLESERQGLTEILFCLWYFSYQSLVQKVPVLVQRIPSLGTKNKILILFLTTLQGFTIWERPFVFSHQWARTIDRTYQYVLLGIAAQGIDLRGLWFVSICVDS